MNTEYINITFFFIYELLELTVFDKKIPCCAKLAQTLLSKRQAQDPSKTRSNPAILMESNTLI
jgi:hypothetical protein